MKLYARDSCLNLSFPRVMGILNVTPDSFSDGGKYNSLEKSLVYVDKMIKAGVDIIDVGGESTRPGAFPVSPNEELERVIPVIEAIVKNFEVWVSVDTSKAVVMREAAAVGVHMINDVRSLIEPGALQAASESGLPICLMHIFKNQKHIEYTKKYNDILIEVDEFFVGQISRCKSGKIKKERLVLDPGFCFGKNFYQNYRLLAYLSHFQHFELPLLVGMSRKSMLDNFIRLNPCDRLGGSLACAVISAMEGAKIIRAHDVKETVEAMHVVKAIQESKGMSRNE